METEGWHREVNLTNEAVDNDVIVLGKRREIDREEVKLMNQLTERVLTWNQIRLIFSTSMQTLVEWTLGVEATDKSNDWSLSK